MQSPGQSEVKTPRQHMPVLTSLTTNRLVRLLRSGAYSVVCQESTHPLINESQPANRWIRHSRRKSRRTSQIILKAATSGHCPIEIGVRSKYTKKYPSVTGPAELSLHYTLDEDQRKHLKMLALVYDSLEGLFERTLRHCSYNTLCTELL